MMTPTPEDLARDLQADLEIYEATGQDITGWSNEDLEDVGRWVEVASAGWGAAIRRALAAEAELARVKARVAELEGKP